MIKIKQVKDLASTIQKAEANAIKHTEDNFEKKFNKNTAFNKNFGTGRGEVAEGNHTHAKVSTTTDGLMSKEDKSKLDGIATGANNYVHPSTHAPSIIVQDANNRFVTDAEKSTWNAKASTSVATTSANGLMASSDKSKLDGIAAGANKYVHPTTDGNKHVPANGTTNNGKVLKAGATAGEIAWGNVAWRELTGVPSSFTPSTHNHPASQITQDTNNRFVTDAEKTKWDDKYSRSEVDNLISEVITSLDWKESVETVSDIKSTYPNPEDGWTVNVKDTDETYRYDGKDWILISANTIPLASTTVDGKMSKDMVIKLDGIATGANKYVHPSTHPASIIAQDANNRFVTDAEKSTWNAKASTAVATTSANGLMSKEDKSKLDGIAAGANKYVHPSTHAPSIIAQDANNRFVTDAEKSTWNAKASTAVATTSANGLMASSDKSKLDGIATGANNYVHPSTHPASIIAQDANNRFVTDAEKSTWNAKASTAVATTSANGLMASSDKSKLDNTVSGASTFNSISGRTITIGRTMPNVNYRVAVTPTSNPDGSLGEIWVESKTTTTFIVKCSGSTTTCTFDWIVTI